MGAPCQTRAEGTRSKLKLLLNVGEFRDDLPTRFVILLVNISDEEVRVPEIDYVNCRNSSRGTISLQVIGGGENSSRGCPGGARESRSSRVLSSGGYCNQASLCR
jgi:hypothetical protein